MDKVLKCSLQDRHQEIGDAVNPADVMFKCMTTFCTRTLCSMGTSMKVSRCPAEQFFSSFQDRNTYGLIE